MRGLRVLNTVACLGINAGGPSRTVPALCDAVVASGASVDVQIATTSGGGFGENTEPRLTAVNSLSHRSRLSAKTRFLERNLEEWLQDGNDLSTFILHDHGQWLGMNRASAGTARRKQCKRVISPRGMLTPWSLSNSRLRKQVAWLLYGARDFHEATVIHATSDLEAEELRRLGAKQPIAIIPNGVETIPSFDRKEGKPNRAVFMSRFHPKKGLKELVSVWRRMQVTDWELLLAGPDESSLVDELALSDEESIQYIGPVSGIEKWQLLENASVFVLPSHSENFGVVVAEALMAGTPVITTHGTPWQSLVENRCGWWIPMNESALEAALLEGISMSSAERNAMGERGRAFACSSFGWPAIGQQMASVYRWMADGGERPACVSCL